MKRDSILVVDFGTSNVHVNVVHVRDGQILYCLLYTSDAADEL